MAKEIERKFLVVSEDYKALASECKRMKQAYLSLRPDSTVRVRISGPNAWLTIKSRNIGTTRNEWEYPIPVSDAETMIAECSEGTVISKCRYIVPASYGLRWEVDEFDGAHAGLCVAEIELPSPDTDFERPSFIGREVSGDPRYYNSSLAADGASTPPRS
ncbi:MAG: CYTH domain-containing protein [Muribaculaceae bacterium]|nr:CYTH domain-containing protein [Muribaculaceae bacterium]